MDPQVRRPGVVVWSVIGLAIVTFVAVMLVRGGPGEVAPSIAKPLTEAPFEVPGTFVVEATGDGCLRVVDGDGQSRTHCVDVVGDGYVGSFFNSDGELVVGTGGFDTFVEVDPLTGQVLRDVPRGEAQRPNDQYLTFPLSHAEAEEGYVTTDGDKVVRRYDRGLDGYPGRDEPPLHDDEVLLDLNGPPSFSLQSVILSPDEEWAVMLAHNGDILVATLDGSREPHVWATLPAESERFQDLHGSINWGSIGLPIGKARRSMIEGAAQVAAAS